MKRDKGFDIAKGIGMLCIIAGHLGLHKIVKLVYPFHVPLFFIMSGYFLNGKRSVGIALKKKCKSLLIPYIITILIEIVLSSVYILLRTSDGILGVQHSIRSKIVAGIFASGMKNAVLIGVDSIGAIWFLPALFVAELIVVLLLKTKHAFASVIALFFAGILISKAIWLPFGISAGLCGSVFVYAGWIAKKNNILQNQYLLIVASITYIIEIIFNLYVVSACNSYPYYVTALGAVLISYGIIILSRKIEGVKYLSDFLCFFGRNSLFVLCIHAVELLYFPWGKLNIPVWLLYICKVVIASATTFFITKGIACVNSKRQALILK